jgi:hypothetical protein
VYGVLIVLAFGLGKARVTGDTFSWPHESISAISTVYFRLLLIGGALYLLGVSVVWLSPGGQSLTLNKTWARLWVFPPGLAVLGFFAIFNLALHNLLLQCRARAERDIVGHLQTLYDNWKTNREPAVETSISALLKWRESVRLERLWPMDLKAGVITVLTLLIPTIEALVKIVRQASQLTQR